MIMINVGLSNLIKFITAPLDITSCIIDPPKIEIEEKLMTKNEAVELLIKHVNVIGRSHAEDVINFYIEAGMLKVEEELSIEARVSKALLDRGFSLPSLFCILDASGFKIVEK